MISAVKEMKVRSDGADTLYSLPTSQDSPIGSVDNSEVSLRGRVRSRVPLVSMVTLSISYYELSDGLFPSRRSTQ